MFDVIAEGFRVADELEAVQSTSTQVRAAKSRETMFEGNLADFEELVLSVPDRNSREYIGEAVVNYQSRSYRSAVSAAWVTITYDIITNIRKPSQQGDAQARDFIARVDRAIALRVGDPVVSKKPVQSIEL